VPAASDGPVGTKELMATRGQPERDRPTCGLAGWPAALTDLPSSRFFSMKFFWEVFVTLFVVIDPPGTVPVFLGLTSGRTAKERNRLAWQAALVAFGVIVVFAVFGQLYRGDKLTVQLWHPPARSR
jgi:MarC family integral membrane protein